MAIAHCRPIAVAVLAADISPGRNCVTCNIRRRRRRPSGYRKQYREQQQLVRTGQSVLHLECLLRVLPELGCPDLPRLARTIERQKRVTVKNIFVGNLDFAATDSSVRSIFEQYGTVDRVNVVTDRDTGRSRGFAFVEMNNT